MSAKGASIKYVVREGEGCEQKCVLKAYLNSVPFLAINAYKGEGGKKARKYAYAYVPNGSPKAIGRNLRESIADSGQADIAPISVLDY